MNKIFVSLYESIVERGIVLGIRTNHIIDAKKDSEQAIRRCPWNNDLICIIRIEFICNLLLKALHSKPKGRVYQIRVDGSSAEPEIIRLDVACVICCGQEVDIVRPVR